MNIKEAKNFYFLYNANTPMMLKDGLYNEFRQMNIPEDILLKWQSELIHKYKRIIKGNSSAYAKIQTIYKFDEMNLSDKDNLNFIKDFYLEKKESLDTFSRILICEVFCTKEYLNLLQANAFSIDEELQGLLETIYKEQFKIDESYKNDPYLSNEDVSKEALLDRIKFIKKRVFEITSLDKQQKISFWQKLFKRKNK